MRELIPKLDYHNQKLSGFGCSECQWQLQVRSELEEREPSVQSVVESFKEHDCSQYPKNKAA